ncbi:hypothetical protein MMC07_006095 [Pseudocyphellaria aurata]|nr:hypothetical protein [Pseudocyphellaria aurata]
MSTNVDGDETKSGERFAHRFETEQAGLEKLIEQVTDKSTVVNERGNMINACFMGIARLSDDVRDASGYTTAYDQRSYSQAINSLRQRLEAASRSQAPKSKFTFKNRPAKASSVTVVNRKLTDAESSTSPSDIQPSSLDHSSTLLSKRVTSLPPSAGSVSPNSLSSDPASSKAPLSSLSIESKSEVHIMPPPSSIGPSSPVSLTNIDHSIIDLSHLNYPSALLTMVNINRSLIICNIVDSAAHITNATHSVIVISSLQVRMHGCSDCIVYLRCRSKPLFENCTNLKLAPLPAVLDRSPPSIPNYWDHPNDISWLHPGPSPNWSVLAPNDRVPDHDWHAMHYELTTHIVDSASCGGDTERERARGLQRQMLLRAGVPL